MLALLSSAQTRRRSQSRARVIVPTCQSTSEKVLCTYRLVRRERLAFFREFTEAYSAGCGGGKRGTWRREPLSAAGRGHWQWRDW